MEIEAKVRLSDASELRGVLQAAGARFEGRGLERNWLYDHPERTLARKDKLLRLREEQKVLLTFKGPKQRSEYKKREELEIEFPDASSAHSLLQAIGFSEWFYYEKIRETWRLDNSEVVLDELPEIGLFVEIEAPSDEEVESVRDRLKLSGDYINASYVELLLGCQKESQQPNKWQFRFPQDYQSTLSGIANRE